MADLVKAQSIRMNYDEAWSYYMTGNFSMEEIADILDFHLPTLRAYAGRHSWAARRANIIKNAGQGLKKKLAERIEEARIAHQNFMLDGLDETGKAIVEMKIGDPDPNAPELSEEDLEKGKRQRRITVNDKLRVLDHQHQIATSVLKLDDNEAADPNAVGFQFLVALQANSHLGNSKAPTGILRSRNALPDASCEVEFTPLQPGKAGPEAIEAQFESVPVVEEKVDIKKTGVKLAFK